MIVLYWQRRFFKAFAAHMNLMSHWYPLIIACFVCGPILAHANSSGAATKVVIFKCVSDSGKLSFQKSPCSVSDVAQRLRVTGDSQANRDAANQLAARTAAERAQQEQRDQDAQMRSDYLQAQVQAQAATAVQTKPPVVCPRIDTDGVRIGRPIEYWDGTQKRRLGPANVALEERGPSKTFLKNAGRWPDECPQ